jgi:peptidoglycan hydrolase-like protein with peptidoglycan-binding domain
MRAMSGRVKFVVSALVLLASLAIPAMAQQPRAPAQTPAPAAATDPRLIAAQQAFDALPEMERRAIQQNLGFTTAFSGAALGNFGTLTYNSILAFERDTKLTADGILSPQERQALALAADNARKAQKFAVLDDARSGVRIGIPQVAFTKRDTNATGGSRWQTADGKATLDTVVIAAGSETLAQLFDKTIVSANPARKVTYKLLRPDFFVVAGETPTGKFYRRMSAGPEGALRGFSLGYDKSLAASMDRAVIAVANTFEPFPVAGGRPAVAAATGAVFAAGAATAIAAGAPVMVAAPRERLASGIILDGGLVLTADSSVKECRFTQFGSRKLAGKLVGADPSSGLALVRVDGLARTGPTMYIAPAAVTGASLTLMGQAWSGGLPAGMFAEAMVAGPGRIAAPLQPGGAGAALFDSSGALAGILVDDPGARRQVAGIVPAARYRFADAGKISAFLQAQGAAALDAGTAAPMSSVAAQRRDSIIAVICGL